MGWWVNNTSFIQRRVWKWQEEKLLLPKHLQKKPNGQCGHLDRSSAINRKGAEKTELHTGRQGGTNSGLALKVHHMDSWELGEHLWVTKSLARGFTGGLVGNNLPMQETRVQLWQSWKTATAVTICFRVRSCTYWSPPFAQAKPRQREAQVPPPRAALARPQLGEKPLQQTEDPAQPK